MSAQTSIATKSRIKTGRVQEAMDASQVQETLNKIVSAIHEIHNRNASQLSFEELYRSAYNLVLQKHGHTLYESVKDTLENHFKLQKEKLRRIPDAGLLESLASIWKDHIRSITMIRDVLMYLDRSWVTNQPNKLSVYEQGNALFLQVLVRDPDVSSRIVGLILAEIGRHRAGELVDLSAIQTTYTMLQQLGGRSKIVVEEFFELPFLRATEAYYAQKSNEVLANSTAAAFLLFADSKLKEERRLALRVFPELEGKLNKVLQKELVLKHAMQIIEMPSSGLIPMIREDKIEDLRLLFQLLDDSMSPALSECARMFGEYIASTGLAIIEAPFSSQADSNSTTAAVGDAAAGTSQIVGKSSESESVTVAAGTGMSLSQFAVSVVTQMISEKEKYDTIVRSSFKGHKIFQKAVKEAFEKCMNQDVRFAQYLSMYCDELLTGKLAESKGNVDPLLDKIVGLFRFLSDKDVFEAHYKQQLSKRLLLQRSISQDAERTMIGKLKNECGHQFTSKLEGMFKDMALSSDASVQFREELAKKAGAFETQIDFSVLVLSVGVWPSSVHYQEEKQIRLPRDMLEIRDEFLKFYMAKHDGRTVFWNYALGSCEVKITGFAEGGTHEFTVSPLQAIAMSAFNSGKLRRTFAELIEETGIPREDMKRHMISMSVSKFQIFTKTGLKREFLDDDVFEFNPNYKSKLRKVKIPLVSMSGMSSGGSTSRGGEDIDPSVVPESVTEARRHLMEASIVRVMKSRKRLDHNNLVTEVLKHLKFKPTPQELKKRIEALIERECKIWSETKLI